jgi:hypothetical protein
MRHWVWLVRYDTWDYTAAREAASRYLKDNQKPTVCLLAGHIVKPGEEIAYCALCKQQGCPDCLDSHECEDYMEIL